MTLSTENRRVQNSPDAVVAESVALQAQPGRSSASLYDLAVQRLSEAAGTVITDSCAVCSHGLARPLYRIEGVDSILVQCCECGLGTLHPLPRAEEIASFYPVMYYGDTGHKFTTLIEALVRLVAARQARFLTRGLRTGSRVLDIGCGRGVMLRAFADAGFEVHGTELHEQATQGADPRAAIHIAAQLEDLRFPDGYFDEVVLWHVLEHLPDPRGTLEEIQRILVPGGRLIVAVPNFSSLQARWMGPAWFHLDPPRHLYHFPLPALRLLLERTGFSCDSEHHFSLRQNPFGWVQSLLNHVPYLHRNGLYALLQRNGTSALESSRGERWLSWLAFGLGMPVALLVSLVAAGLRSGATVHVVAHTPSAVPGRAR